MLKNHSCLNGASSATVPCVNWQLQILWYSAPKPKKCFRCKFPNYSADGVDSRTKQARKIPHKVIVEIWIHDKVWCSTASASCSAPEYLLAPQWCLIKSGVAFSAQGPVQWIDLCTLVSCSLCTADAKKITWMDCLALTAGSTDSLPPLNCPSHCMAATAGEQSTGTIQLKIPTNGDNKDTQVCCFFHHHFDLLLWGQMHSSIHRRCN